VRNILLAADSMSVMHCVDEVYMSSLQTLAQYLDRMKYA